MAKITKWFDCGVISIFIAIEISNSSEGSIFFAEKIWFCQRRKF